MSTDPQAQHTEANPYAQHPQPTKRLYRTCDDQMVGGVCGGLARYFGVDPTLVRVLAVVALVLAFPAAIIGYVLAWAIMPSA